MWYRSFVVVMVSVQAQNFWLDIVLYCDCVVMDGLIVNGI